MFVHESLVCPEQLNCLCTFFGFPASFAYSSNDFDTADDWGTYTQLLQKIQTFTDAPEGTTMH